MGNSLKYGWSKQFINKSELKKQISLLNSISEVKKIKYYQNADIFCAPYVNEAFAITLLEVLACGYTIAVFENSATKEVLSSYPNPYLLSKEKTAVSLAKILKKSINHSEWREKTKQYCLKRVQLYSWDIIIKQIEEIYYRIANSHVYT